MGRGQPHCSIITQGIDGLDRALAKGPGPHQGCPARILEGPGEDFRGTGTAAIDEDDHGKMGTEGLVKGGDGLLLPVPPPNVEDWLPGGQEETGHLHGDLEDSPWISPQV